MIASFRFVILAAVVLGALAGCQDKSDCEQPPELDSPVFPKGVTPGDAPAGDAAAPDGGGDAAASDGGSDAGGKDAGVQAPAYGPC